MDRNTITALLLTLLLIVVYMQFMAPKRPTGPAVDTAQQTSAVPAQAGAQPQQAAPSAVTGTGSSAGVPLASALFATATTRVPMEAGQLVTLSNDLLDISFSGTAGDMYEIRLQQTPLVKKGPIDTAFAPSNNWQMPLRLLPVGGMESTQSFSVAQVTERDVIFAGKLAPGLELRKHYRLATNTYIVQAGFTFRNTGDTSISLSNAYSVLIGSIARVASNKDRYARRGCDLVMRDPATGKTKLKRYDASKKDTIRHVPGPIDWCGVRNKYFTHIVVPRTEVLNVDILSYGAVNERMVSATTQVALPELAPGEEYTWDAVLYAGPIATKYLQTIAQAAGTSDHFEEVLHLGWSAFLAKPILNYGLKGLYALVHNYGLAIIIITVIIKLLTWPLQTKSFKSMQEMQKLQPEIKALQEKYKGDPKKLQEEQMLLYRKHGVNPLGGCLPLFLQLPIFIALYNALSHAVELWGASFLWIKDLSMPDTVYTLPFTIPVLGDGVNPLPLMMTAASIGQQMLTPHTGDKSQQKMMFLLPAVFMFIFYNMPSGLVLYWFVNQVLTMGQMFYLHRVMKPRIQLKQAAG
jgi:YidC/Oxa1 family membrane protein insertase